MMRYLGEDASDSILLKLLVHPNTSSARSTIVRGQVLFYSVTDNVSVAYEVASTLIPDLTNSASPFESVPINESIA